MTTNVYSTVATNWLLEAEQAFAAGGPVINLAGGTLKVGDGNGVVPTASAIIANGGVLHQVWQGGVNSVAVDASNALQIDVGCLIPTVDGSGTEIGPFNVTEFAIYDATGNLALVGTTNLQKTTSAQGQLMTLQWFACYTASVASSVTVQPPSGSFPTLGAIQGAVAGLLSANAPLSVTPSLQSSGWTDWLLAIASATLSTLGIGRPATNAEYAAGAPASGGYAWPWPTLQQVTGAIAAVLAAIPGPATIAQVIAGALSSVWVSPASLIGALNGATLGSGLLNALQSALAVLYPQGPGWQKLPGGIYICWGTYNIAGTATSMTVTLPIPMPGGSIWHISVSDTGPYAIPGGAFPIDAQTFTAYGQPYPINATNGTIAAKVGDVVYRYFTIGG